MVDNQQTSPNPSNANNVRNVNTDGSLNNNNANNSNGVVPDYVKLGSYKSKSIRPKSKQLHKELSPSPLKRRN